MVLQRWHDAIPRIHDAQYGGFGNSKKFPQGLTLDFCLEMFELNGGQWLQIVETTLKNQVTTMAGTIWLSRKTLCFVIPSQCMDASFKYSNITTHGRARGLCCVGIQIR